MNNSHAACARRLEELDHARKRHRLRHARAVDLALQHLPLDLAVGEEPHGVAQLPLAAAKVGRDPAARLRGRDEDAVIAGNRVVEVDAHPHSAVRSSSSSSFRRREAAARQSVITVPGYEVPVATPSRLCRFGLLDADPGRPKIGARPE